MIAHLLRAMLALTLAIGGFLGYWLAPTGPWRWPLALACALLLVPISHALALALACALLLVPISHALGLLPGFTLTELADHDADHRQHRSGRQALWRAYFSEVFASTWAFCCLQALCSWRGMRPMPQVSGQGAALAPVLLIHGYFCNRTMWLPLVRYWRTHTVSKGRQVDGVTLTPAFTSLDNYVDQIHHHVERLQGSSGRPIVLIAHSMGGLAARAYLRAYGHDAIQGVITLGSPHQGTVMADYGHGPSVRQMRIGNRWLDELATHERMHSMPPFEVIISLHDNIVAPRHTQTIPQANTQIVEGIGHMGLAQNRDIWRLIDNILQRWDRK